MQFIIINTLKICQALVKLKKKCFDFCLSLYVGCDLWASPVHLPKNMGSHITAFSFPSICGSQGSNLQQAPRPQSFSHSLNSIL